MRILDGIRVLELSNFITGPYAGMLLGDLGAEVIKIEPPDRGDPFRAWGEGPWSPHFCAYNRNKRSMTLNLRRTEAQEVMDRLVKTADVLIENYRPGVTKRLGIDYSRLKTINPQLVYCSITAYGATGPYRDRPGYDTVGQGTSGMLSMFIDETEGSLRGPALADSVTGLTAVYGILAALVNRSRTDEGQLVETSLLQASLSFLAEPFSAYFHSGKVPGPFTRPQVAQAYAFTCADGRRLAIHLSSPQKFWEGLTRCMNKPELAVDARFATREARVTHYRELQAALAPLFAAEPRSYWLARLDEHDVPCSPVYTLDETLTDPQVQHLEMLLEMQHPTLGLVRAIANPLRCGGQSQQEATPPPALGQDTETILESLGYTRTAYQELADVGAV